ncbi:MAG: hypothetical protein ACRC1K_12750 [Planctomycetia bacterium]
MRDLRGVPVGSVQERPVDPLEREPLDELSPGDPVQESVWVRFVEVGRQLQDQTPAGVRS